MERLWHVWAIVGAPFRQVWRQASGQRGGYLRLLAGVYADLGIQLDRLDPETVTMPRLQALVFTYVFDSAEVDGAELDLSARRLSAFVAISCGHGYPLMESLADLFADVRED